MGIGFAPESLEIVRCPGALLDSGKDGKDQIALVTQRPWKGEKWHEDKVSGPFLSGKKQLSDSQPKAPKH